MLLVRSNQCSFKFLASVSVWLSASNHYITGCLALTTEMQNEAAFIHCGKPLYIPMITHADNGWEEDYNETI